MRIDLDRYVAAFGAMPDKVREAEVNGVLDEEVFLDISDGDIIGSQSFARTRLYVRASGEKTGMSYTEKLDEDPRTVIARALDNSRYSSAEGREPMNSGHRPLRIMGADSRVGVDDLLEFGATLERKALMAPKVASVNRCTVRKSVYATRTVNTKGLDAYAENSFYSVTIEISLTRPGRPVTGTAALSARELSAIDMDRVISLAISDGDLKDGAGTLKPCSVKGGVYPAVLSNAVTRNILVTAWLEFSGERMQNGISIYSPKTGTPVGSPFLNITNAPGHRLTGHYLPLDCEGSVCKETVIVREGSLVTPLYTLASAQRAGQASTGSAGRVAQMTGATPINITTVPAVIYVEPGEHTVQELIAKMGSGLFLTYSLDKYHSINLTSGDFSIPCGGVYYEGGKPVGTVSQITMAGNLRELFGNITAVGDDLRFEEFFFKNYSYGGPSLLVRELVFAK